MTDLADLPEPDAKIVAAIEAQLDDERLALRARVHELESERRRMESRIETLLRILEKLSENIR